MTKWRPTATTARRAAIALTLAGIVHILVVFAMPVMTGSNTFRKFAGSLPANRMDLLPPIAPGQQPLPFMSPDSRYAVCRYDTSAGPVAVSVNLPDIGWVLALYSLEGDNFYHVVGQSSRRTTLSLLLVPPSEQVVGTPAEAQTATPAGAPVTVAARQGLLFVRAPERGAAYRQDVEAELKKARCTLRRT
jgi:uncharacterized membrane protein